VTTKNLTNINKRYQIKRFILTFGLQLINQELDEVKISCPDL
jgi:hypothetical protein